MVLTRSQLRLGSAWHLPETPAAAAAVDPHAMSRLLSPAAFAAAAFHEDPGLFCASRFSAKVERSFCSTAQCRRGQAIASFSASVVSNLCLQFQFAIVVCNFS